MLGAWGSDILGVLFRRLEDLNQFLEQTRANALGCVLGVAEQGEFNGVAVPLSLASKAACIAITHDCLVAIDGDNVRTALLQDGFPFLQDVVVRGRGQRKGDDGVEDIVLEDGCDGGDVIELARSERALYDSHGWLPGAERVRVVSRELNHKAAETGRPAHKEGGPSWTTYESRVRVARIALRPRRQRQIQIDFDCLSVAAVAAPCPPCACGCPVTGICMSVPWLAKLFCPTADMEAQNFDMQHLHSHLQQLPPLPPHYQDNYFVLGPPTMRGAIVFSGSSHPALVDGICDRLGSKRGSVSLGSTSRAPIAPPPPSVTDSTQNSPTVRRQ